jgi:hypothetical protein
LKSPSVKGERAEQWVGIGQVAQASKGAGIAVVYVVSL